MVLYRLAAVGRCGPACWNQDGKLSLQVELPVGSQNIKVTVVAARKEFDMNDQPISGEIEILPGERRRSWSNRPIRMVTTQLIAAVER